MLFLQSAVPHMVVIVIGNRQSKIAVVAEQLAIFRILRALKMVKITIYMCVYTKLQTYVLFVDFQVWWPSYHCANHSSGISS